MPILNQAKTFLDTQSPALFYVLVTLAVLLTIYVSRKLLPWPWAWLASKDGALVEVIKGAPAVLLGATFAVEAGGDYHAAFLGSLSGLFSIAGHHILKLLPVPYQGAVGEGILKLVAKMIGLGIVLTIFVGCAGVQWPSSPTCTAAVNSALADLVADVLFGTGDVQSQLGELAKKYTPEAVLCAVDAFTKTGAVGASPETARAQDRAREFLKSTGSTFRH